MKHSLLLLIVCMFCSVSTLSAQDIEVREALFQRGDKAEYRQPAYDDSQWKTVSVEKDLRSQKMDITCQYGWYRIHVRIPRSIISTSELKGWLRIHLPHIDDCDETYLNGHLIGKMGIMPRTQEEYSHEIDYTYPSTREYLVDSGKGIVNWDADNVIAIRIYNANDRGGMLNDIVRITPVRRIEGIRLTFKQQPLTQKGQVGIVVDNRYSCHQSGRLHIEAFDIDRQQSLPAVDKSITLGNATTIAYTYDRNACIRLTATYTDKASGNTTTATIIPHYIQTPPAPAIPRYNGAAVYGVRPGSPIIFKMAFSGNKPMTYSVPDLPEGLTLDTQRGVIQGSLAKRGEYPLTLVATNAQGTAKATLTIKVGNTIALTPPMGWNSWNCWGLSVSQEKVMASAQAMLDKGLADYGFCYVNVDDSWPADQRAADGTIRTNEKFPDMKQLGDWLHERGFKFGIYSSPGDRTCGNYLGSINHEEQDANTFNAWGIDYLKYDWCGYSKVFRASSDRSHAAYLRPYMKMQQYLRQQPRDIFYSLCQYGMDEVWKWGPYVDANSWRTTGDITDTWTSLYDIGFNRQAPLHPYAAPGHWNDPDMLIVGKVGWSDKLRDTRLTTDEQYTHISLWALLAANMLIGCDVAQMDDFTQALLCNNEVLAVNQDPLGKQAHRQYKDDNVQIWMRQLYDGSYAVGIFNVSDADREVMLGYHLPNLDISNITGMRDLWRQADITSAPYETTFYIPAHGVKLLKISHR